MTRHADSDAQWACAILKILSNPQRFRILRYLDHGEASVGELESALNLKQPNLSHELRKLREHQVVSTRRESKVVFYSIADGQTRKLIQNIINLCDNRSDSPTQARPSTSNTYKRIGFGLPQNPSSEKRTNLFSPSKTKEPIHPSSNGECGHFSVAVRR